MTFNRMSFTKDPGVNRGFLFDDSENDYVSGERTDGFVLRVRGTLPGESSGLDGSGWLSAVEGGGVFATESTPDAIAPGRRSLPVSGLPDRPRPGASAT